MLLLADFRQMPAVGNSIHLGPLQGPASSHPASKDAVHHFEKLVRKESKPDVQIALNNLLWARGEAARQPQKNGWDRLGKVCGWRWAEDGRSKGNVWSLHPTLIKNTVSKKTMEIESEPQMTRALEPSLAIMKPCARQLRVIAVYTLGKEPLNGYKPRYS